MPSSATVTSSGEHNPLDSGWSDRLGPVIVNIHEAKTHFSKLIKRVAAEEEIIIGRAGKPVARLVPVTPPGRRPGVWKGKVRYADYQEFDSEIEEMFESSEIEPSEK